jgi:predicted TIM-barrel fold metal-dependent hydrolase
MPVPIVDCHSHVFNAEDLPIDGFIRKLAPTPGLLTGIVSVPLDRLTQWVAKNSHEEAEYLATLLVPRGALEAGGPGALPRNGSDLLGDAEVDELFRLEWERRGLVEVDALEAAGDVDAALAAGIAAAPSMEHERDELDRWLLSWGDPDLDFAIADEAAGLEGPKNWYLRIKAAKRAVRRFVDVLRLVTKDRHLIASDLATTYPGVALFVPALVDFEYTTHDKPSLPGIDQITVHSLLSKVSVVGKIPGAPEARVHPLVAFCPYREVAASELAQWDPAHGISNRYIPFGDIGAAADVDRYRPDITFDPRRARRLNVPVGPWETSHLSLSGVTRSLDIVRHAIELGGFVGVKLYPPAGYLPLGNSLKFGGVTGPRLDAALRALYAYCEGMEVPILAHASHSNGFGEGYDDLAGPEGWRLVLSDYPDLRLCFGHFGHLYGVGDSPANPAADSWARRFVELIDAHPHVYADVGNSKFPIQESYRNQLLLLLQYLLGSDAPSHVQQRRRARVMFGTDYWMNTLSPGHRDYLSVFEQHFRETFGEDAQRMFMGGNALRWLGIAGDENQPDRENANRKRLMAFYGPHPLPDWLA